MSRLPQGAIPLFPALVKVLRADRAFFARHAEALRKVAEGLDPGAEGQRVKAEARRIEADLRADTLDKHTRAFLDFQVKRVRKATHEQEQHVLRGIAPARGASRAISDIRRRDVIELVEQVASDRPIMANRAVAVLHRFFRWLTGRDVLTANPVSGVKRPSKEQARERALSRQARELIAQQPLKPGGPFIFSSDGSKPISGFSHLKREVDAHMQTEKPWVWHDLRRTAASGMQRLGIRAEVIKPAPSPWVAGARAVRASKHRSLARTDLRNLIRPSRAPRRRRCPAAAHLVPTFVGDRSPVPRTADGRMSVINPGDLVTGERGKPCPYRTM